MDATGEQVIGIVTETTRRKGLPGEPTDEHGVWWSRWYAPFFEDYAFEAWERMTDGGVQVEHIPATGRVGYSNCINGVWTLRMVVHAVR